MEYWSMGTLEYGKDMSVILQHANTPSLQSAMIDITYQELVKICKKEISLSENL